MFHRIWQFGNKIKHTNFVAEKRVHEKSVNFELCLHISNEQSLQHIKEKRNAFDSFRIPRPITILINANHKRCYNN